MKTICVFGLGYIGLPMACLLATHGYQVTGIDVKKKVVEEVDRGETFFEEPGLGELLQRALASHSLVAKTEPEVADVFLIAVPTPLDREAKIANLSYVKEAANSIFGLWEEGKIGAQA